MQSLMVWNTTVTNVGGDVLWTTQSKPPVKFWFKNIRQTYSFFVNQDFKYSYFVNQDFENFEPWKVHCRCGHVAQKCQYFVRIRGRFRPFDENLSSQCEPKVSLRKSLQITSSEIPPVFEKHKFSNSQGLVTNTNVCGPKFIPGKSRSGCWS